MPELRSFHDEPGPPVPYDFELRVAEHAWSYLLVQGKNPVASLTYHWAGPSAISATGARGTPFPMLSAFEELQHIHIADPVIVAWDESQVLVGFALKEGSQTLAVVRVSQWPSPGVTHRVWQRDAGHGIFDGNDNLMMTSHNAWRDSELKRRLVVGMRKATESTPKDAALSALCLAISIGANRHLVAYPAM